MGPAPGPRGAVWDIEMENRIAEFRHKKGWSQQILADKLATSRQTISRWELGDIDPPLRKAMWLARELGTTMEELFPLKD